MTVVDVMKKLGTYLWWHDHVCLCNLEHFILCDPNNL